MIYALDAELVSVGLGFHCIGNLTRSLEIHFKFSKCSYLSNSSFSYFFHFYYFSKWLRVTNSFLFFLTHWISFTKVWISFSKDVQLWSTSLVFREHRKCPFFFPSVLIDFFMSEDLSFMWCLNYSFSIRTVWGHHLFTGSHKQLLLTNLH